MKRENVATVSRDGNAIAPHLIAPFVSSGLSVTWHGGVRKEDFLAFFENGDRTFPSQKARSHPEIIYVNA